MIVKKFNGKRQEFDKLKIEEAIKRAAHDAKANIKEFKVKRIANKIEEDLLEKDTKIISSSDLSKLVEDELMSADKDTAWHYITYHYKKEQEQLYNSSLIKEFQCAMQLNDKKTAISRLNILVKLMAASATGLTFIIIAAFLQPLYPDLNLYKGGNLFFHLIVPIIAMIEFVLIKTEQIPFGYTFLSAVLALVYGTGYCMNILINGKGVWPDTNDWYGFLNWGWPVGIAIFAFVVLMDWIMACLLRFLNKIIGRR